MILNFLKKHKEALIIFLVGIAIFVTNYSSGRYLIGWDSLQTELQPWLAVKRAFFSVWQEYQGLGLIAGMAHASDLVRAIAIWLLSLILPNHLIRYFFHVGMLLLGGFGAYRLMTYFGIKKQPSLLGCLFYMLNLGTIQIFYLPFEPFSIFFGFLPWELWIFTSLVQNRHMQKKDLFLFLLINVCATPQSYLQTMFVVYVAVLGSFTLGMCVKEKKFLVIKRAILLFLGIFLINSFWLLPQLYFLNTSGHVIKQAKINQLSTDDLSYQNRAKGDIKSFSLLQGFYYELYNNQNQLLFQPWKDHFNSNLLLTVLPYIFAVIIFIGFIWGFASYAPIASILILCAIALLIQQPPFSIINTFLRQNEFINQIFRTPFTKFIVPYSLVTSFFLAVAINSFFHVLQKQKTKLFAYIIIIFILILYSFPTFQGYFFSPNMKQTIPMPYFKAIEFFKQQDKSKRIALLPDYTFWGWFKTKWGYDGSGFLWYGIEQPIISRTFDVWSDKSEGYFWEIKNAIEADNVYAFQQILNKYNVSYLLLDKSLLPVTASVKGMQYDFLDKILRESTQIKLLNKWDNLWLYENTSQNAVHNFIELKPQLPNIGPRVTVTNEDITYLDHSDYITKENEIYDWYYPFLGLQSQTRVTDQNWTFKETPSSFILSTVLPEDASLYEMVIPQKQYQALLYANDTVATVSGSISVEAVDGRLTVSVPKQRLLNVDPTVTKADNCAPINGKIKEVRTTGKYTITAEDGALPCFGYSGSFLDQRYGYVIKINNTNQEGRRLLFYVQDLTKKQSFIEDRLKNDTEYYLLNPRYQYGLGYGLSFQANSYFRLPSTNTLNGVEVYFFPFEQIKNIILVNRKTNEFKTITANIKVNKKNYFSYQIELKGNTENNNLILNQSFHPGWKAYEVNYTDFLNTSFPFLFGREIKEHVLINNWANGWKITAPEGNNIVLIFWGQYLEFVGFGLLIITLLFILFYRPKYT